MEATWGGLLTSLRRESEGIAELIELGRRKRDAIRDADLAALEEVNAREEIRALSLRDLGQARRDLVARLIPGEAALSLREAIPHMPAGMQAEAAALRQGLLEQVRELGQVTQGNAELLKGAIERVDRMAQILLGAGQEEATYRPRGGPARPAVTVMDRQG